MDCGKIGKLIYALRKEQNMTQQQLAERMNISDKAVSKWERGLGCPDVSLLSELAHIFNINMESLLTGEFNTNAIVGGNMKKLKFYVCPTCGNLLTAASEAAISCCGKRLAELTPVKAENSEKLTVEIIENEYFVSTEHEMTKDHFISFIALLTGDSLILRKQYPEWNIQTRIPRLGHGILMWHCTKHGLYYQLL